MRSDGEPVVLHVERRPCFDQFPDLFRPGVVYVRVCEWVGGKFTGV